MTRSAEAAAEPQTHEDFGHPPEEGPHFPPQSRPAVGTVSDPDHVGVGPERLQEVLPEINRLALRVGGLRRLGEIIQSLERGQS